MNKLFEGNWLIISIANEDEVVNLALIEDTKFLKLTQMNNFNFNEENGLISIEDLRALRHRKQKIERIKKQENISLI